MPVTDTTVPIAYIQAALYRAKEEVAFVTAFLEGAPLGDGAFQRVRALALKAQEENEGI